MCKRLKRFTAFVTSLALLISQLTFPPRAEASHLGSSTASAGSAPPPAATAIQSFQPDLFTGRATTSVPIAVPPGRKGMQPSLGLTYSSSGRSGWVGVGWGLDAGYIERATKNGVPKYDTTDTYTFMFQGVASDLIKIPDGTYRAKDEGLFLRFEDKGISGWEVRDKSGSRYLFGQTAASQVENTGNTFRWCLEKVIDTNGNSMAFSYAKDQGQLYLAQIRYTAHEPTSLAPANQVDFILENRLDIETSYRAGFEVRTAKRLRSIETRATVSGVLSLARRYDLVYTPSSRTGRSLLTSVTQVGSDGTTSLPPVTFTYQAAADQTYPITSNNPSISAAAWNLREAGLDTGHENFGCVSPYAGLPWGSSTVVTSSANFGCLNASVGSDGSLTVNGCQDHFMHAWTWVYVGAPKTISLSYSGAEACVFREDSSGIQNLGGGTVGVPLQAGWSMIHLTGYHQHEGWTNSMSSALKNQVDLMSSSQFIKPQLTGDVDGNGTSDLITFDNASGAWSVSYARSAALSPSGVWLTGFGNTSSTPLLGDWNGDGKTDIGGYANGSWQFATSTGASFQTSTISSLSFGSGMPLTGDFNGDGKMDLGTYSAGSWQFALQQTNAFAAAPSLTISGFGAGDDEPLTGDFNGDGLTDAGIAHKTSGNVEIRLATGSGFTVSSAWATGVGPGQSHTTADVNGDGLTDVVYYDKSTGRVSTAASTGTGFATAATLPVTFSLRTADDQLQLGDFNGDGLSDPAVFNPFTGRSELTMSGGTSPDLLTTIANGLGGATTLAYQASSELTNTMLPFVIPVVQQTAVSDGMGNSYATTYSYQGGLYDAPTKEFRGFARADVRDADANTATTEFHQDEHKKGRPFRSQFIDQMGVLWTKAEQTWSCTEPYPGVHFIKLDQTDAFTYDGDATFKQTRSRFTFDSFGNVTRADEDGEFSVTGDERSTVTSYTLNQTAWILNKPSLVQTLDTQGVVVAQRRFYFDGATTITAAPAAGHLTKEEEWLNLPTEQWLATTLAYDAYGNVKTVTDALGRTTTNTYDTATGTYLIKIANTQGHTRQLAYDARFGQVTSSIDQNGLTATTEYDALGRVTNVIGPNDTATLPTVSYEYTLSPTPPNRTTVHTRVQSGSTQELVAYAFTDGLGRTIQTRSPAEDPTKQVVSGAVELNTRGLAIKQWAPYLDASSTSYVPHTLVSGLTAPVTYTYDPLGRLLTTADPDGSVSSTTYDDWSVTSIDANGHQSRRTQDAYGRLITVEEFNSGQTYTTTYQYDTLNNLTQVTDTKGNITRISYDSLGRKLSMDDPDMGRWSYAYDAVDNLTSQTDARGVVTAFAYDTLNRLTQKSYTIPAGSTVPNPGTVTYTYDGANDATKPFTKGKLTKIADGSGSTTFEYDNLGRLIKESKTVDGTTYVIQRQYDLLGRLTSLTYPDNEVASYTYNPQGGIETVSLKPVTGSTQSIVTGIDYNAAGQLTKISYGNGTSTDYSYNPQTLRLSSLVTRHSSLGTTLQDFSYTFDPVGNVTAIQDSVHTGSQTFEYDPLNRLTKATGAYGAYIYAYDPLGNMLEKEGVTMTYGLADGSKPHAVTATSAGWALQYDANGNLIEKVTDARLGVSDLTKQLLKFDAENRLVEVQTAQDETLSLTFKPGWNFFALPVIPEDGAVTVLLPAFAQDFEQVARFEPTTNSFKYHVGNPKFDDFADLEYGVGYQVYCKRTSDVTVTFRGKLPTKPLSKSVSSGWKLLPALSLTAQTASTAFSGVNYSDVKAFTSGTGTLTSVTQVSPGQAYWVNVTAASTWTPPLPKNVTTSFVYDGDGGKVKQVTASGTTTYLGEVLEKDPVGKTTKYVFAGGQRIAAKASDGMLRFFHTDHLGSSNVVTDATGQLAELTEYTPYGSVALAQSPQPTASSAFKFTGQRQDTTNGLILFPARAYDPQLGRFLSPDPFVQEPADPQTLNRYAYVRNNPVNLVDPSGYGWLRKLFTVVAVVVATIAVVVLQQYELLPTLSAFGLALMQTAAAVAGDQVGKAIEQRQIQGAAGTSSSAGGGSFSNHVHDPAQGVNLLTDPTVAQAGQMQLLGGARESEGLLSGVSNFFAGVGDMLSFGITNRIRERYGLNGPVDKTSGSYKAGGVVGFGLGLAAGGVGSLNAGSRTVLYSGEGALEIARAGKGAGLLMEQTVGGRFLSGLEALSKSLTGSKLPQEIWDIGSAIYAANAKGPVHVFLRNPTARSVYNRIEKPVMDFFKTTVERFM